jgi:lysine--8-amino-7-oxononanoate aminotransferase
MLREFAMRLSMTRTQKLTAKDKKYLWHPFTQMQDWQSEEIVIIEEAQGCYLKDTDGKRYLDGVSSLWCNVHGHQVAEIDEAIRLQLNKVAHSTFLGLSNVPAIEFAEKLIQVAPKDLTRVFYSDSGSSAVEIALKMAYQYWQQKGFTNKNKFIKLTQSYHGDTLGAVSVGGIGLFHQIYKPLLFDTLSVESPYTYRWKEKGELTEDEVMKASLKELETLLEEKHKEVVAFVMEPLMQGAAGMIAQPAGYISRVRELTKKYNVLLIFDEVATGFGRTGKMFASDHENVTPDLLTVAKGISGGYLPLAATLATEEIYNAFLGGYEELKTFFHGHTYTANPLACAASIASLGLFEKNHILDELSLKIDWMKNRLKSFYDLEIVGDVRQQGTMIGIELVKDQRNKASFPWERKIGHQVITKALKKGVIIRPLGSVVVLMPPLGMEKHQLEELFDVTYQSIEEVMKESL